jgi:hypothetical protein
MARMYPILDASALNGLSSQAEARFYVACCDQLPPTTLVIHSLALIRLTGDGRPQDAEADFVIIDQSRGVMVVEVKGGGIEFDPRSGQWTSIGRSGRHQIKDPFRQAMSQKHALLSYVQDDSRYQQAGLGRLLFAHAVMFPDVDNIERLRMPSVPSAILGGRIQMGTLPNWLSGVFDFWIGDKENEGAPGASGLQALEKILCSPISVRPLLSLDLATEEAKRIELTRQQSRLLRAIGMRIRATICGGAGTGKTLLALERAREMARSGKRTLLLCYNRALGDHLKAAAEGVNNLHTMTFHQLCDWRVRVARSESGKDFLLQAEREFPRADRFNVQLPYALALSAEETSLRYDAIIVDEAQDFPADFWLPIEMLLADQATSHLYAFLDHNQSIYRGAAKPPIDESPFLLTTNCRNTRFIHEAAYRHYTGIETDYPEIDGSPVDELIANNPEAQAAKVASAVTRLLVDEKVTPKEVVVLVLKDSKQALYDAIGRKPLPRGVQWGVETHRVPGLITVDTVSRFKGLEAAIVFLCGFETASPLSDRELLYVGLSRAKSRAILVGSAEAIRRNLS